MKRYWENLRPNERRIVAVVGVVVFVLFNFWFVVPHFSDWGKVQARNAKAQKTLVVFQNEINQKSSFERMLQKFQGEGQNVPAEDQSTHFSSMIQSQAIQAGVGIQHTTRQISTTNAFFLELSQTISVQAREQQIVDFLYNLGSSNSMIRVRDLVLTPDQPRQQLSANIKLVASYQKKPAVRSAATTPSATTKAGATPAFRPPTNSIAGKPVPRPITNALPHTLPSPIRPSTNANRAMQRPPMPGPRLTTNRPSFFNKNKK
jgi:hypothetical protein